MLAETFMNVAQATEKWGLSYRRVLVLVSNGRIEDSRKIGVHYFIPKDAPKPLRYTPKTTPPTYPVKPLDTHMTSTTASKKWGITPRRIQILFKEGRIPNAELFGDTLFIPIETTKPTDKRLLTKQQKGKL